MFKNSKHKKLFVVATAVTLSISLLWFFVFFSRGEEVTPQLTPEVNETAEGAIRSGTYVVATAQVPRVTVFLAPPPGEQPGVSSELRASPTSPIPREGLNSAGVKKLDSNTLIFDSPTFFGNPTRFLVLEQREDWVQVLLPARPNGQTGWIKKTDVSLEQHQAVVNVDLSERRLVATVGNETIVDTVVSIGTNYNPTPTGLYYITEVVPQDWKGGPFGPFALATSAYSEELEFFDGGLPVVAIHGTNSPATLGASESNGCLRIANDLVTILAEKLPPGTPLLIW